mmetsp:Transcript_20734/g.31710  ORF Transcript_20734/g.31710 Transcript_20734/m.31710 type:complete len:459 (-) Transcript_20734:1751-3127(-)
MKVLLLLLVRCTAAGEKNKPNYVFCDFLINVNETRIVSIWSANGLSIIGRQVENVIDNEITQGPFLCRVDLVVDVAKKPDPTNQLPGMNDALVTLSSNLSYLGLGLKRKKGQELDLWNAFVAKVLYARAHGMPMYLLLGTWAKFDRNGNSCGIQEIPTIHYLKIPGVIALLDLGFQSVTYVDLDTVPLRIDLKPADYLISSPLSPILVGSSNFANTPIIMNGGVFIATQGARSILEAWFAARCGIKDQLGLWKSLFLHWNLKTHKNIFANYELAHAYALPQFVYALQTLRSAFPSSGCQVRTICAKIFQYTGCLLEPLTIGNITLLPTLPFTSLSGKKNIILPPLQAEFPHSAWWCHKKCPTPHLGGLRNQTQTKRLLKSTDGMSSACFSSNHQFVCPCGRLVRILQGHNFSSLLLNSKNDDTRVIAYINDAIKADNHIFQHRHHTLHRPHPAEMYSS